VKVKVFNSKGELVGPIEMPRVVKTDEEWQKLSAINAADFLCTEAIDQAKSHPSDERAPEALYRCLRAVHLGCSNDKGTQLAKSAFQLLHRRFPDSPWAEKGKVWYKGGSCQSS